MPALHAVHDTDPRVDLLKKVGMRITKTSKGEKIVGEPLGGAEFFGNMILVAVYVRPKKARHGTLTLELADSTVDEDKHQGKVGLVIGLGPLAFVDDDRTEFHGQKVEIGDWVVFRPSEGWAMTLTSNQVLCRHLTEQNIRMKIRSPDDVW
jgi:hypothetical protein